MLTRRDFFLGPAGGFARLALIDLLTRDQVFAKGPYFPAKAKRCVFLFMNGAPSQVDTFDPKPELDRRHGQPYKGPLTVGSNGRAIGYLMKSPFPFK